MKVRLLAIACCLSLAALSTTVFADTPAANTEATQEAASAKEGTENKAGPHSEAREKLKQMSPAERKAFRAQVKQEWNKLSVQEKQAFRDKVKPEVNAILDKRAERCKSNPTKCAEMKKKRMKNQEKWCQKYANKCHGLKKGQEHQEFVEERATKRLFALQLLEQKK